MHNLKNPPIAFSLEDAIIVVDDSDDGDGDSDDSDDEYFDEDI